jgi:hypothetical protein
MDTEEKTMTKTNDVNRHRPGSRGGTVNMISDFYEEIQEVARHLNQPSSPGTDGDLFSPGFSLPAMDEDIRRYLSVADVRWSDLDPIGGRRVSLLNLFSNPGTRTTKTMASLIMVLRAVQYIRASGEGVMIVAPSSGNKAIALRDAVGRAIAGGLATADELRILTITPDVSQRASQRKEPAFHLYGGVARRRQVAGDRVRAALRRRRPGAARLPALVFPVLLELPGRGCRQSVRRERPVASG